MSKIIIILILCFASLFCYGQSVNVDDILKIKNKKKFKISGGLSANGTYFNSNNMAGRQPFTYQLTGNVNISIYELVNIPLSINYNNYGFRYTYPNPPSTFSFNPTYKWISANIGDVSISFSPYTLNGHLFRGVGISLSPPKWNIMAMGGRLNKKVDYNKEIPSIMPSFDRYGGGAKFRYTDSKYFVGANIFVAKDNANQTSFQSDSLGVFPKNNIAAGLQGGINITSYLKVSLELAGSMLNRDIRPTFEEQAKPPSAFYYAIKSAISYTVLKNTIGITYERISPGYQTLGAYYFTNDFENITANYARPFYDDRITLAINAGLQRDDLANTKDVKNLRLVGSLNINYNHSEDLNMSLSASSFQAYRNIKSQFDYINENTPYENLDTLNYTQISQNIDYSLNWQIAKTEKLSHNFNLFTSFQQAAEKQGSIILPGNLSNFLNSVANYNITLLDISTSINTGFNYSNNYASQSNSNTYGPSLSIASKFLKNSLMTGLNFSYNHSDKQRTALSDVYNLRINGSYRFLKKHSVQASYLYQKRLNYIKTGSAQANNYSTTATMSYFYSI